ncbi:MAG: UDP-N-acetylmuramoyl-tripeptide--D-alanyl-D-alanine ligase [Candidatus Omnitrophica bacterium]|nr:UDP-N-acetylmuramoyl-tripeptide--D-alanyl-D-alanine ligase [Candidatus Omnitrophota bacterium]
MVKNDYPVSDNSLIRVADPLKALAEIARGYREQFNVEVLAITGSTGKTTTKEIIAKVLARRHRVLATPGNFNNQIGLPLTLLELETAHRFCVIEMGMNHPGEIEWLCQIAKPSSGLITGVGWAHAGFFENLKEIALAKAELLRHLPETGRVFLNTDTPYYSLLKSRTKGPLIPYGTKTGAVVKGYLQEEALFSFSFKIGETGRSIKMGFWNPVWMTTALAAMAVGKAFGVPEEEIKEEIESMRPLPGRGQVLVFGGLTVIDESYNSNPDSLKQALLALQRKKVKRTVAVIGDMAELGKRSSYFHAMIGRLIRRFSPGLVLLMGKETIRTWQEAGEKKCLHFDNIEALEKSLPGLLYPGDLILVKGSRIMGLEKIVSFLNHHCGRRNVS